MVQALVLSSQVVYPVADVVQVTRFWHCQWCAGNRLPYFDSERTSERKGDMTVNVVGPSVSVFDGHRSGDDRTPREIEELSYLFQTFLQVGNCHTNVPNFTHGESFFLFCGQFVRETASEEHHTLSHKKQCS